MQCVICEVGSAVLGVHEMDLSFNMVTVLIYSPVPHLDSPQYLIRQEVEFIWT
jgi:hypothetical protein